MMKLKIKRTDVERALILCASALVVALALRTGAQNSYEEPFDQIPVETSVTASGDTQQTVVYYADGDGYLIPVTRSIVKSEGVAKATLGLMVASSENDMQAARLGLKTVIPSGTTFDLDIEDGKARVDMSKDALSCANAEEEALMVSAVAGALTEFDTVDAVTFLFDGQKRSKLTYGTDVSGAFTASALNLESAAASAGVQEAKNASLVRLYFPSASGRMLVPVTRLVYSDPDVTTGVLELLKGPKSDSGLEAPLPKDCGLIGVKMKNGVVTLNFTKEFMDGMEGDEGRMALRAVLFTAAQFPGVKEVKLQVEGKSYSPPEEAKATFLNDAQDIMTEYPGVIETD